MKTLRIFLLLFPAFLSGQSNLKKADWSPAILINESGDSLSTEIVIDNQFFEGTIICKYNDQYKSVSPESISEFYVLNEGREDTIHFKSVLTRFLKRPGAKKSFLKVIYEGENCSLYGKHIPNKRSGFFILPVGGGWFVYGIASYLTDEEVLFVEYRNKAFQFTKPRNEEYSNNRFKVDDKLFFDIISDKKEEISTYMKEEKMRLKMRNDIISIITHIDSL